MNDFLKAKIKNCVQDFLNSVDLLKSSEDQVNLCEKDSIEKDLQKSIISMKNDKFPGSDGLATEFYKTFWNELKDTLVYSVREAKEKEDLSPS